MRLSTNRSSYHYHPVAQIEVFQSKSKGSHMTWPINLAITSLTLPRLRSLIRSCDLSAGTKLHAVLITSGLLASPDTFLPNALLHFYSANGRVLLAGKVFDEIPSTHKDAADWTTLIGCLATQGIYKGGLHLFVEMRRNGVRADGVTLLCVFNACAQLRNAEVGTQAHGEMAKTGFGRSVKACNAAMDMYVKCGMLGEARRVFETMEERTVVSWTVVLDGTVSLEGVRNGRVVFDAMAERNMVAWTIMLVGYIASGLTQEGFSLLCEMVFPSASRLNQVTLCSVLSACSQSGDLLMGKWVHVYALKTMLKNNTDIMVETALVDMYAKCGRVDAAMSVFKRIPARNVVAWNAMFSGLAMHGKGRLALELYPQMIREVNYPDEVTFTALLSGCSHSGLVKEGRDLFHNLKSPKIEHYACMVDLLGRAGHLQEAADLISEMPMRPNEVVLGSLLGSCSVHKKLELGEQVMKKLIKLNPGNTEYHVLLSNMYAFEGKREKADSIRRRLRKIPGMSSIRIGGEVHEFAAGDKSHPRAKEIYAKLDEVIRRLRLTGYVPNTDCGVFSEAEEAEQALFSHGEKLAVCFGLISTRAGSPLYIFKNLRICLDCHNAMKIVSKVYGREIVVRDRNRFHRFKCGSCSCCDYW